jgi:valyl-tRNA synthetase
MPTEPAKAYDPKTVEKEIYQRWIAAGAFNAEPAGGDAFCMVIPPPNVTAALHLGHALNNTLQDILVRWRRMQGYNALWMPGTDHAGIATQTVVDKRLKAAGKPDLAAYRKMEAQGQPGRQQFVAQVQAWKDQYEATIIEQLQRMGCSCDWRRTRFTMDEMCAKAVRAAFFKLFSDGLIYRGKRLVNWDPATQTVLADDEVEHEEVKGHFYYLRYPLADPVIIDGNKVEHVTVATTRPETMLGDTAVAMSPADPRAKFLVGKMVRLPIVGRIIPIIADDHVVLPVAQPFQAGQEGTASKGCATKEGEDEKARFSTGFLKVTPAHDPEDYAIRQRHPEIGIINVMAPDGTISNKFGWTDWDEVNKDRFEAREAVVEFFRQENLLAEIRDYVHQVGHSYRSHVPIEPYLSDQWYIAVKKPIADCGLPIADSEDTTSPERREQAGAVAAMSVACPHDATPGVDTTSPERERREQTSATGELTEQREGITYIKDTDVPANSLAGLALMPLLDGRLKFTPDRYANNYRNWLENLRDWPISRQLWWGHQIPIWSKHCEADDLQTFHDLDQVLPDSLEDLLQEKKGNESFLNIVDVESGELLWPTVTQFNHGLRRGVTIFAAIKDDKYAVGLERCGFTRDPDVLDTWFSSALWPFSTLGWPDETADLNTFYPGDVLSTAREIITLWVSRMVMMGQYCVGDIPFRDVFIHAMIQDGQGRKMSKSLGNGIDPLDIIDSHGADAMRFTLAAMTTQTQDVRVPVEKMTLPDGRKVNASSKFDAGRNFANKLWNASRFAMMNLPGMPAWDEIHPTAELADAWILSRLNRTIRDATAALESYSFNDLADTLYHFTWDDFCDWYLEIAKGRINAGQAAPKAILAHCLDNILRLLHPVMPFITEAIWSNLDEIAPNRGPTSEPAEPMLVRARWPMADSQLINPAAERDFGVLAEIVRGIRNVRMQHNVPPGRKVQVTAIAADRADAALLADNIALLQSQANLGDVTIIDKSASRDTAANSAAVAPGASAPADAAALAIGRVQLYVLGIVDREKEIARLGKQAQTLERGIAAIEGKLASEGFVAKAPPALVEKERQRLASLKAEYQSLQESLEAMR